MPKKIDLKTKENTGSVRAYIDSIPDAGRRRDAKAVLLLMKKVTGKPAKMWGSSIVGFGSYEYKRSNGDYGEFMATGFSARKNALTIYIMPGYQNYAALLAKLGPHKLGKSCLYLKSLEKIDMKVLEKLICQGLTDLQKMHTVS